VRTSAPDYSSSRMVPGMKKRTNQRVAKKNSKNSKVPYQLLRSSIQGRGAFATRNIRKGERIVEYKGEKIDNDEADRRYPDPKPGERHHTFLFELDDDYCIDAAVGGNSARFINHSCDPNCDTVIEDDRIFVEAVRDIKRGEELAYDYHYILDEPHNPANKKLYPCNCGTRKCRGTILGKKR
jgi:SET domain-containing protein